MFKHLFIATALIAAAGAAAAGGMDFRPKAGEPYGVVTGQQERPGSNLFRVEISEINGQYIGQRGGGLRLKPGTYVIRGTHGRVDQSMAGAISKRETRDSAETAIELEVEAGKTYYLALHAEGNDRSQWKVVNWQTLEH